MACCFFAGLTSSAFAVTVSSSNIHIYGAPSGSYGHYLSGDTITVTWDNTASGDNNSDSIYDVKIDFFGIPGQTNVTATSDDSGFWEASYTLQPGDLDDNYLRAYVTAIDLYANSDTTSSYESVNVDTVVPQVSPGNIYTEFTEDLNGDGIFNAGDTITASWDNTASGDFNYDVLDPSQVSFNIFDIANDIQPVEISDGYFSYSYTGEPGTLIDNYSSVAVEVVDDAGLTSGLVFDDKYFAVNNTVGSVVPIPAAVWLFGFGLTGLVAVARWKE